MEPPARAATQVALSALLAFVFAAIAVVGAPPSLYVQEPSPWLHLEFMLLPSLCLGVALSLVAFFAVFSNVYAAAVICVASCAASMIGVTIAWGLDAEATLRGLTLPLVLLSVPLIGGLDMIRRRSEKPAGRRPPVAGAAG